MIFLEKGRGEGEFGEWAEVRGKMIKRGKAKGEK